jgi:hypothetical protein
MATVLQTAAHNQITFVMARLFLGMASAWFGNSVPLLINEIAFPPHRRIANALFNCGWYVGSITAAWVTFGTRNYADSWAWRIPSVLQAQIPFVALPGFLLSPESPRWLISVDYTEKLARFWQTPTQEAFPMAHRQLRDHRDRINPQSRKRGERQFWLSRYDQNQGQPSPPVHLHHLGYLRSVVRKWCCVLLPRSCSRNGRDHQCDPTNPHLGLFASLELDLCSLSRFLCRQTWTQAALSGVCRDHVDFL